MIKKIGLVLFFTGVVVGAVFLTFNFLLQKDLERLDPTAKEVTNKKSLLDRLPVGKKPGDDSALKDKDVLNILLIGIDRRSKSQTGFNTDIMILASIKPETKQVLLTSVPRDLWINGNKINALYTVFGDETLVDAFEKITGMEVDGYIRCDFMDFKWLVDSMGGVPVTVERTFTDNTFPNNSDTGILSVTFTEGYELMTGERALTFARSRKGNNGEGSDLMRAKRQHLLLQGMVQGISGDNSKFWPMNVEDFFNTVTAAGRLLTTMELEDAHYLWRFYDERDQYEVTSFVIGADYVYHPGMYPASDYHAWVFIPRDSTWSTLHRDIQDMLDGTFGVEEEAATEVPEGMEGAETPTTE
jgi:LCP family protein required for cell wall assembly